MANRFALEPLIITKLAELSNVTIRKLSDLSSIHTDNETQPAIYVSWHGCAIDDSKRSGTHALAVDTWMFILAMVDSRPESTSQAAGSIIADLLSLLNGWTPAGQTDTVRSAGEFRIVSSPSPYYRAGISFYPVVFTISMFIL